MVREAALGGTMTTCDAIRVGVIPGDLQAFARSERPDLADDQVRRCTSPPVTETDSAGAWPETHLVAPIAELPSPGAAQALMDARDWYARNLTEAEDRADALGPRSAPVFADDRTVPLRRGLAYFNARTLRWYGHVRDAEATLRALIRTAPDEAIVSYAAFVDLHNLLVIQGREADLEALAREYPRSRQRISVLEFATLRAATQRERLADLDGALALYRSVVADPRFVSAADHAAHVREARVAIARLAPVVGP